MIKLFSRQTQPTVAGHGHTEGCVLKGANGYQAEQGSHYAPGISTETVGSSVLWFGMVSLAPGQRTKAHIHEKHETAFYFLSGEEVAVDRRSPTTLREGAS